MPVFLQIFLGFLAAAIGLSYLPFWKAALLVAVALYLTCLVELLR
ncbi:MAG TPA: hypothetical protein VI039_13085 [Solirubrobacterales bacterium]